MIKYALLFNLLMEGLDELKDYLLSIESARVESANNVKSKVKIQNLSSFDLDSLRIGAVDSSFISEEFHSFDLIITKTAGAIFEYSKGRLSSYEYYPSPVVPEKYYTHGTMDLQDSSQYKNILRLKEELSLLLDIGDKCDVLLVDGSLFPLARDKPSSPLLKEDYSSLIKLYLELFSKFRDKLVGVVKDSRSRMFMDSVRDLIDDRVYNSSVDSVFLDFLLKKGGYVGPLTYSEEDVKSNPVLRDFDHWGRELKVFYTKPGKYDRPLRLEMFNKSLMPIVYALSSINDKYAYPAILIDVDLRAMINPKSMERVVNDLQSSSLLDSRLLRRNSRPFRR